MANLCGAKTLPSLPLPTHRLDEAGDEAFHEELHLLCHTESLQRGL